MGTPLLQLAEDGRATLTLQRRRLHHRLHREDLLALQGHFHTLARPPSACSCWRRRFLPMS